MTARQWISSINSGGSIYKAQELRGGNRFRYWKRCIGAPEGTKVVTYPGVDFGLGRYHCFPSLQAFKEYCESERTMACTCGGVCRVIQGLRVAAGLGSTPGVVSRR